MAAGVVTLGHHERVIRIAYHVLRDENAGGLLPLQPVEHDTAQLGNLTTDALGQLLLRFEQERESLQRLFPRLLSVDVAHPYEPNAKRRRHEQSDKAVSRVLLEHVDFVRRSPVAVRHELEAALAREHGIGRVREVEA